MVRHGIFFLDFFSICTDLKTGIEKNSWCDMEFPDPDDIMNFTVTLKPDEVLRLQPTSYEDI